MSVGVCTVRDLSSVEDFTNLLVGLKVNEALVYGVLYYDTINMISRA